VTLHILHALANILLCDPVSVGNTAWTLCLLVSLFLWESLIVYEKENEKDSIGSWESDPCYDIDGLRYSDRMWGLLFSHLLQNKQNMNLLIFRWTCEYELLHFMSLYISLESQLLGLIYFKVTFMLQHKLPVWSQNYRVSGLCLEVQFILWT
jgi:hypothetical protein